MSRRVHQLAWAFHHELTLAPIRCLVVDTSNWWRGHKVVIARQGIQRV